jgi:serine/threonine protein phosphatase PrpC
MNNAVATTCPACGAAIESADEFCEACGARLGGELLSGACTGCGAPSGAIGRDGYCSRCGLRQRRVRDHQEIDLGVAASVTDRGLRHHRNEDAVFLATAPDGAVVAVVCDGVSLSVDPDIASDAAADAAGQLLVEGGKTRDAIAAAEAAVAKVSWTPTDDLPAPASTIVTAVCRPARVSLGWVGDSRAYWLGLSSSQRLTVDDSWAEEQVDAGAMTEAEAEADPRAHSITRWLGADAPPGDPQLTTFTPNESGRLVVCSDGLWNYAPSATDLVALLATQLPDATPLAIATSLADFALAQGGHDNITVIVVDIPARQGAP